ncbi:MAG: hypothetical protein IJU76_05190 [Desulfovibrionaceae bacterium]|nr:hypothetical protein [Desulfovibrionaceae bacterium]
MVIFMTAKQSDGLCLRHIRAALFLPLMLLCGSILCFAEENPYGPSSPCMQCELGESRLQNEGLSLQEPDTDDRVLVTPSVGAIVNFGNVNGPVINDMEVRNSTIVYY